MKKKGLSQVVSTIVLIALTITLMASAWAIINNFVGESLEKSGDCREIYEQVIFNEEYTCYDATHEAMMISISRKDFDMTSLLVSIMGETSSKTFSLLESSQVVENVKNYPSNSNEVNLPNKEAGKTYCVYGIEEKPNQIKIAPKVGSTQCEVVNTISTIIPCYKVECENE